VAYDARVYRILVASPSDVERNEMSFPQLYNRGTTCTPILEGRASSTKMGDHTAPEYGTAPGVSTGRLSRMRSSCRNFLRIGSPLGVADSGTLEEIERVGKAGKPICSYFSRVPIDPDRIEMTKLNLEGLSEKDLPSRTRGTYQKLSDFRENLQDRLEMKYESPKSGAIGPFRLP